MFVTSHRDLEPLKTSLEPEEASLNWLDAIPLISSEVPCKNDWVEVRLTLEGTQLSCAVSNKHNRWERRIAFLKYVIAESLTFPKDEPLCLISMGSDHLLMEFLIGKALLDHEFKDISFVLIDPNYKKLQSSFDPVMKSFRSEITKLYNTLHDEPFESTRIKFLSRAQNIPQFFPKGSHVVVVEALPPNSLILPEIRAKKLDPLKVEEMFFGNIVVPPSSANALTFMPKVLVKEFEKEGLSFEDLIPSIHYLPQLNNVYFNWGVILSTDCTFRVVFAGTQANEKYNAIAEAAKKKLEMKIEEFLPSFTEGKTHITQKDKTAILEKIKKVVGKLLPNLEFFFLASYPQDRTELVSYLSGTNTNRKIFTMNADRENPYSIEIISQRN